MLSKQAIAYHYSNHRNSDTARTLLGDTARGILETPQHLELRLRKSARIVKAIWKWGDARNGKHSPKSKMAKALTCATEQRAHLERILHDPEIPFDNKRHSERYESWPLAENAHSLLTALSMRRTLPCSTRSLRRVDFTA